MTQTVGPVILDVLGPELNAEDKEILQHPAVGGVILFTRNYENPQQIAQLCTQIRKTRATPLLITVDQEGGRVQRFKEGFTRLPPMGAIGNLYASSPQAALTLAENCGWIMAAELLAVGVDLSFAPVLDLNKELNTVVGDRSFHKQFQIVVSLAKALISGMKRAGMAATGKHFPGHGSVTLDSHYAMPIDSRDFEVIAQDDLKPFAELNPHLQAMMPAHILFEKIDAHPVGFSAFWLKSILRKQLQFSGIIFSDDLNMKGADFAGDYAQRAKTALEAGCDMILICNNRAGAIQIIDHFDAHYCLDAARLQPLRGQFSQNLSQLKLSTDWKESNEFLSQHRKLHEYN
jgi:beta-N-acetylhexosaminidase